MARVFISASREDFEEVHFITRELEMRGHMVLRESLEMEPGRRWDRDIRDAISRADVLMVVFSSRSMDSKWFDREYGMLRGFAAALPDGTMFLPVVIGKVDVPIEIQSFNYIQVPERNSEAIEHAVMKIAEAIDIFIGRKSADIAEKVKERNRVEQKASIFMEAALKSLTEREEKYSKSSDRWYLVGYLSLFAGVVIACFYIWQSFSSSAVPELGVAIFLGIKSILLLGLLIALSKYAFSLGKSAMNEALKNADRKHAISFGNFYMEAFSDGISSDEVKEIFSDWNLGTHEGRGTRDEASDFDPKLLEQFTKLVEAIRK